MINSLNNEDLDGEMLMEKIELNEIVLSLSEGSNAESSNSSRRRV